MSRVLEEEAMVYIDECVSISTFDDSGYSLEDPPLIVVWSGLVTLVMKMQLYQELHAEPMLLAPLRTRIFLRQSLLVRCNERSSLPANKSHNDLSYTNQFRFEDEANLLFSSKPSGTTELEQDIRNYLQG